MGKKKQRKKEKRKLINRIHMYIFLIFAYLTGIFILQAYGYSQINTYKDYWVIQEKTIFWNSLYDE